MTTRQQTGQRGEDIAADYLMAKGYRILDRNWRCSIGELDIIMEKGNVLVFVEVRTRTSSRYGSPEESITPAKQAKLIELAHTYLQEVESVHASWRIDIAAVVLRRGQPHINHIENAVGW